MTNRHERRPLRYGPSRTTHILRAVRINGSPHKRHVSVRVGHLFVGIALTLLPILAMVAWVSSLGAERRSIYGLPPDERAVVYADTLRDFEATCIPPRAGRNEHCRARASFLVNFADCDDHCRHVTAPSLHWHHR